MSCVEMYDGRPFCGEHYEYDGVRQGEWHFGRVGLYGYVETVSLEALLKADCPECLRRIAAFGEAARLRLVALEEK